VLPVAFVGVWCLALHVVAAKGGWKRVGARHPARFTPPADLLRRRLIGTFGRMSYNHTLTVGVLSEGLYLATSGPFVVGHRPLMIPWSAIRRPRRERFLVWTFAAFEVDDPPLAHVRVALHALEGAPLDI
jgi:hypothetical protein